jgi:putative ATP-binding cassette transporter
MNRTPLALTSRTFLGNVWAFTRPYWYSEEKWVARGLLAAVVAINLGMVYITVLLNHWYNDFYNTLQNKDAASFGQLLIVFAAMAAAYIVLAVYQLNLNMLLQIRWRRWLTGVYFNEWLSERVYYRLELKSHGADNPDQRMQEDLKIFTSNTLSLGLGLMRSVVSLFSFVFILWTLSGPLLVPIDGAEISIPGYMVWAALLYAVAGTWLAHRIGQPLIGLNFDQQRFEADLRFALVRLRENAEGVAFYRGENDEKRNLLERFGSVWWNWWLLIKYQKRLIGFTAFYEQLASIFPIVVAAPRYFSGAIQLGGLMQISSAFGRVQDALSWFITAYSQLAEWKATVDRLTTFHQAIVATANESRNGTGIATGTHGGAEIVARDLRLALPDGRSLIDAINLRLKAGEHVVVTGPSGSGKSTLFRALAGIWPYGGGQVQTPERDRIMFLPQRPYLPIGTLREVVTYPTGAAKIDDARIVEALRLCHLESLAGRLDERGHWTLRLSPGEQQRLAFARALLNEPQWLFLDEATAALDETTEDHLYGLLRQRLANTTVISIAHRPTVAAQHQRRIILSPTPMGTRLLADPVPA